MFSVSGPAGGTSSRFGLRSCSCSHVSIKPSFARRETVCILAPVSSHNSRQGPAPTVHSRRSSAACRGAENCFFAANCSASSALTASAATLMVFSLAFCVSEASARSSRRLRSACTAASNACGDSNCCRSVRSGALPPRSVSSCTSLAAPEFAMPGGSLSCALDTSISVRFSSNHNPAGRMALTAS